MTFSTETEEAITLEQYLASEKEAIVSELTDLWLDMKKTFQRDELCEADYSGMPVRLIASSECWWELHTGDVQYETTHAGFWGSGQLDYDLEESELHEAMESLASELISGVLDEESEADNYWQ